MPSELVEFVIALPVQIWTQQLVYVTAATLRVPLVQEEAQATNVRTAIAHLFWEVRRQTLADVRQLSPTTTSRPQTDFVESATGTAPPAVTATTTAVRVV